MLTRGQIPLWDCFIFMSSIYYGVVGVAVGVDVFVGETVGVAVGVDVFVGETVGVAVGVDVFVGVVDGVFVGVWVGVFVFETVVGVGVLVGVRVGFLVGVGESVGSGVSVGVGSSETTGAGDGTTYSGVSSTFFPLSPIQNETPVSMRAKTRNPMIMIHFCFVIGPKRRDSR